MRRAIDLLGDGWEQGVRVIGSPKAGCRHCGEVVRHLSEDGKVVVYRPDTNCCYSALEDQISFCRTEIERLNKELADRETEMERLADDIAVTESAARGEALSRKLKKAEAHMPVLRQGTAQQVSTIAAHIRELREAQRKLIDALGL